MTQQTPKAMQVMIDSMAKQIEDKGYPKPEVYIGFTSQKLKPYVTLSHGDTQMNFYSHYDDPLGQAQTYVDDLPNYEDTRQEEALKNLSEALAAARKAGLEFDFELKSENLLCMN